MRKINKDFYKHLKSGTTTICRCWKIRRKDGKVLGFSDHDADLKFDDCLFEADSGMDGSALQSSTGLSVDNAETNGALSSRKINAHDIDAGKYDSAEIWQWIVNWQNIKQRTLIFRGFLGEIKRGPVAFNVELRGLSDALSKRVGRICLRQCTTCLGDKNCQIDLGEKKYFIETKVVSLKNNREFFFDSINNFEESWFSFGRAVWLTGSNAGQSSVIQHDAIIGKKRMIQISSRARFEVKLGDKVRLISGCDKSFATCKKKFENILNFQGFPFIPGEDWAMAYPIKGNNNDGSSLGGGR